MFKQILQRAFSNEVRVEQVSLGVAKLVLNQVDTGNCLTRDLANRIEDSIYQIESNSENRCIIITSALQTCFAIGVEPNQGQEQDFIELNRYLSESLYRIADCKLPTIACIQGTAFGAGMELAMACDLRLAWSDAEIGLMMMPGAGLQKILKLLPYCIAKEMLFTGALYKADYIGRFKGSLFNHVLPTPEGTYEKCVELAKTIARNGPIGVQAAKACANESFGLEPAEGDMITEKHYTITLKTQDRIRALEAVANKEVPVFIGN